MEQLISVRSLFKETDAYAGKQIKVGGWVRNLRASKNFGFINLSDGTFFSQVQVVYGSELANFAEISKLNIGAAVIVTGTLVLTPEAKQPFELQASEVFVEGPSTPDYPIQPKRHSMEYLRTVTHLRPRTNTFQAVFRVRSLIAYAIHKFFQERDFVYVHTPLITGSDCEGAGEMFQVTTLDLENVPKTEDGKVDYSQDFFGKKTSLTVSHVLAEPGLVLILPEPEALERGWCDLVEPLAARPDHRFVLFFDDIDPRHTDWYQFRTNVGGAFSLPENVMPVLSANYEFPANILSRGRKVSFPVFDEVRCMEMVEDFLSGFGVKRTAKNLISIISADYTEEFSQKKFTELSPRSLIRYLSGYEHDQIKRKTMVELSFGPMITRPDAELFYEFNIELMRSLYGEEYIQKLLKERLKALE